MKEEKGEGKEKSGRGEHRSSSVRQTISLNADKIRFRLALAFVPVLTSEVRTTQPPQKGLFSFFKKKGRKRKGKEAGCSESRNAVK